MPAPSPVTWHRLTPSRVARQLDVDPALGLGEAEVQRRRRNAGPNAVFQAPSPTLATLLTRQVKNFVFMLLLTAAGLSWILGKVADAVAVLVVLALNAFAGLVMDYRAEQSMAALRSLAAPSARVRRNGHMVEIPAADLVPGDVLVLEAGAQVPADARLIEGSCHVDESLLTGESAPVLKRPAPLETERLPLAEHANEVFASTLIVSGSGTALVTAIGAETQVGRLGRLMTSAACPKTPLTERLDGLGRSLAWMTTSACVIVVLLGWWQGRPLWPAIEVAVALAIAAIPEGLPTVSTLALAAGARRLAKRGLLLRRLGALEALGNVSTLCLDKTGTLTTNAMTVRVIRLADAALSVTGAGWEPRGEFRLGGQAMAPARSPALLALLRAAQICNDAVLERHDGTAWHVHGDPSEGALLVAAAKAGLRDARPDHERLLTLAAGVERPWMLVVVREPAGDTAYIKGAPEQVAVRCAWSGGAGGPQPLRDRADWLDADRVMADDALRVFGVAYKRLEAGWTEATLERGWEWLGLIGMADPPRPGAAEALAEAHRAGIRTVMLTGDQPATALAIARELAIAGDRAPVVAKAAETPIIGADVYARITPEGKFDLVRGLQAHGEVVGMTGDGVNDAPALRAAEVGIAMGQGADVAKAAAAGVLLDQRLSTVLAGVREGRTVFLNIQKAVDYLLTCSFTAMLVVMLAMAVNQPQPLAPLQILYLNLLMHSFPALGLATEPAEAGVMDRPPLPRGASLLSPARSAWVLWQAVLLAVVSLAVGSWALTHGGEAHSRTLIFATLATALLCHTLSDRSPRVFGGWRARNGLLFVFLGAAATMQLAAIYLPGLSHALGLTPIAGHDWLAILVAAGVSVAAIELSKPAFRLTADEPPSRSPGRLP